MDRLRGKVVVITGASSGLGRETALQLAARGCALVLAARNAEALEDAARACREAGGSAITVVTDVTREDDVDMLARAALATWGRIDVWINNAGVTVFSPLEEGPFEEHRRVVETNLFGAMYGARAAVPIFRAQGHGILINVSSVLGKIGQAFVPSYVVSKFALRGLSEALRVELADEPDIHVCTLYPYAIDTPHFQSAANEIGRMPVAMPPVQSPEKVARAIVDMAEHPRRERHVPRIAALGLALHTIAPKTVEQLLLHSLRTWHFARGGTESTGEGNLYEPASEDAAVHGDRRPQIGTVSFALWALRELARIQAGRARRRVGRWRRRAR